MADQHATKSIRFAIVLGVFLLGITGLRLARQDGREAAWCCRRCTG